MKKLLTILCLLPSLASAELYVSPRVFQTNPPTADDLEFALTNSANIKDRFMRSSLILTNLAIGNGVNLTNIDYNGLLNKPILPAGSVSGVVMLVSGTNRVALPTYSAANPPTLTYISRDQKSAQVMLATAESQDGVYFLIRSTNSNDTNQVKFVIQ